MKRLTLCLILFGLMILTASIILSYNSSKREQVLKVVADNIRVPADPENTHSISQYDVIWDKPGIDSRGSMPVGNGDIGLNAWIEQNGDLVFYIGKIDSYDGNHNLLKLGRVRVSFSPNPFIEVNSFNISSSLNLLKYFKFSLTFLLLI